MAGSRLALLCLVCFIAATLAEGRRVFAGNRAPLVIDGSRMINASTPGDLDAVLKPQRPLGADTQTMAAQGYHKQTQILAGGAGTHLDSPDHVCGGLYVQCATPGPYRTIEMMRPEEMLGPLCVINVRNKAAANPNYLVQVSDLTRYVTRHGPFPDRAWVIMDSGWSVYAYDEAAYKNIGADGKNHFPGWSGAAIQWLINNTNYTGIGVDTLSVDKGESQTYEAHTAQMGSNRFAVESVDLSDHRIPAAGAWVTLSPTKFQGAPEAPTRILILA